MPFSRCISSAGAALLLGLAALPAIAQDARGLPFRDPAQLEQWLAMDDARFNALLETNWPAVQQSLEAFFPPGQTAAPLALSFAGPQRSCLLDQVPIACRLYMRDLARIQRQNTPVSGAGANPFLPK